MKEDKKMNIVSVPVDPVYVRPSILIGELEKSLQKIEHLHSKYVEGVQKELDKIRSIFGTPQK